MLAHTTLYATLLEKVKKPTDYLNLQLVLILQKLQGYEMNICITSRK